MVTFNDFVIKLMVIEELIDAGEVQPPYETGRDWLVGERNIDPDAAEALLYDELFALPIPEAEQWARDLEITEEQLEAVTELSSDGGLEIYQLLAPTWDGEDDLFDVKTWTDITSARFPNLTYLTYHVPLEGHVRDDLASAGVTLDSLLPARRLEDEG